MGHPRLPRRRPTGSEPGSFLLEALLAAALSGIVLAGIAPLFARQIELAKRARDTDLLETAVTKDVNAIRQFARYWGMKAGPYSEKYLNQTVTGFAYTQSKSGTALYQPFNRQECQTKDIYLLSFLADLKNIRSAGIDLVNFPRVFGLPENITPKSLVSRYKLTRTLQRQSSDPAVATILLSYQLEPLNNAPDLAIDRTAELQLEKNNGC